MWRELTAGIEVPVSLHLDHCPDRDGHQRLPAQGLELGAVRRLARCRCEENQRQTVEVVAEARSYGAHVEGEIEAITGVEDGIGSDEEAQRQSLPVALDFIRATGVDVLRARRSATRTASTTPSRTLDAQRVSDIVAAEPIPIALHGGTGMTDAQFTDLIARGCAKVNISTALKVTLHEVEPGLPARRARSATTGTRRRCSPRSAAAVHGHGRRPHAPLRQRRQGLVTGAGGDRR